MSSSSTNFSSSPLRFGLWHLRGGGGGLSRSLLLQHGNEAGTKTTCFHRNDYIEYIKNLPVILSRLS